MSCSYAASQGWLIVSDDVLTLTTVGLGQRKRAVDEI